MWPRDRDAEGLVRPHEPRQHGVREERARVGEQRGDCVEFDMDERGGEGQLVWAGVSGRDLTDMDLDVVTAS